MQHTAVCENVPGWSPYRPMASISSNRELPYTPRCKRQIIELQPTTIRNTIPIGAVSTFAYFPGDPAHPHLMTRGVNARDRCAVKSIACNVNVIDVLARVIPSRPDVNRSCKGCA